LFTFSYFLLPFYEFFAVFLRVFRRADEFSRISAKTHELPASLPTVSGTSGIWHPVALLHVAEIKFLVPDWG
jgi:hypothetical protein